MNLTASLKKVLAREKERGRNISFHFMATAFAIGTSYLIVKNGTCQSETQEDVKLVIRWWHLELSVLFGTPPWLLLLIQDYDTAKWKLFSNHWAYDPKLQSTHNGDVHPPHTHRINQSWLVKLIAWFMPFHHNSPFLICKCHWYALEWHHYLCRASSLHLSWAAWWATSQYCNLTVHTIICTQRTFSAWGGKMWVE